VRQQLPPLFSATRIKGDAVLHAVIPAPAADPMGFTAREANAGTERFA